MEIGIILNTNDAETCWNCFRLGNEEIGVCPVSAMEEMIKMIEESDKILTFW